MEMIPARPWQSKSPSVSTLLHKVQNEGTQGVQARYGAELPPFISINRCPGRSVILGMENRPHQGVNMQGGVWGSRVKSLSSNLAWAWGPWGSFFCGSSRLCHGRSSGMLLAGPLEDFISRERGTATRGLGRSA